MNKKTRLAFTNRAAMYGPATSSDHSCARSHICKQVCSSARWIFLSPTKHTLGRGPLFYNIMEVFFQLCAKDYNYIRKTFTYDGKRYTVYGKDLEEALTKKVQLLSELKSGQRAVGGNMTVSAWYAEWKALYKEPTEMTSKSLSEYDSKFNGYIKPAIGTMRLKDVRDVHLQKILNTQAGMSFSHVTKLRALMRQMFHRAHRSHLIPFDPAEDLALPRYTKNARRSLTDSERKIFLEVEPSVKGGVFYFAMLHTGMRPGELIALQWRDVDFKKNEIHVRRALESGTWNRLKEPKTESGTRTIPMHAALRERLLPLRGDPVSPVFLNQAGNMHSNTTSRRLWEAILRAMDIRMGAELYRNQIKKSMLADDLVPYCLRHTFCTDLQRAGVPLNVAKELMGHSDISITANIYTHRDSDLLHESIAKLEAVGNT